MMTNKFSEGQQVIYQGELVTILDCRQTTAGWLYDIELPSGAAIFNVAERNLVLPVDSSSGNPARQRCRGLRRRAMDEHNVIIGKTDFSSRPFLSCRACDLTITKTPQESAASWLEAVEAFNRAHPSEIGSGYLKVARVVAEEIERDKAERNSDEN